MFSVIIPTLQRASELRGLVEQCSSHPLVAEIIVINNAPASLSWESAKVRVLNQDENIYVNPAWNLGAREARSPWLAILNDDLTIDPRLFDVMSGWVGRRYVGIIGADPSVLGACASDDPWVGPTYRRQDPFGVAMFLRRENYVPIPDDLLIWFGDDWLFTRQKHRNFRFGGVRVQTEMGTTSHRPEFVKIVEGDGRAYAKYGSGDYCRRFALEDRLVNSGIRVSNFVKSLLAR